MKCPADPMTCSEKLRDVFYEDDGEAADESGFVYHDDVRFDDD